VRDTVLEVGGVRDTVLEVGGVENTDLDSLLSVASTMFLEHLQ
jgi:hypothetical protein